MRVAREIRPPVMVCAWCGAPAVGMATVRPKVRRSACKEHGGRAPRKRRGAPAERTTPLRNKGGTPSESPGGG